MMSDFAILDPRQCEELARYYHFLRNVECGLRLMSEQYSNHLPQDETALAVLARLLDYAGGTPSEQADAFMEEYQQTTGEVREFYRGNLDVLLRISL